MNKTIVIDALKDAEFLAESMIYFGSYSNDTMLYALEIVS